MIKNSKYKAGFFLVCEYIKLPTCWASASAIWHGYVFKHHSRYRLLQRFQNTSTILNKEISQNDMAV